MKKHLITATLIVTLGLAAGCGAEGVSSDIMPTTAVHDCGHRAGDRRDAYGRDYSRGS